MKLKILTNHCKQEVPIDNNTRKLQINVRLLLFFIFMLNCFINNM